MGKSHDNLVRRDMSRRARARMVRVATYAGLAVLAVVTVVVWYVVVTRR